MIPSSVDLVAGLQRVRAAGVVLGHVYLSIVLERNAVSDARRIRARTGNNLPPGFFDPSRKASMMASASAGVITVPSRRERRCGNRLARVCVLDVRAHLGYEARHLVVRRRLVFGAADDHIGASGMRRGAPLGPARPGRSASESPRA